MNCNKIRYQRQVPLPVTYKTIRLDCAYRIDVVIEDQLILELKTVERLLPVHEAQLLTYLKLGHFKTGLLLNFHASVLKDGMKRMVV